MMESPWEGSSRGPLRAGLAAIAAFSIVTAALNVYGMSPSAISHPNAPRALLALGHSAPALALLVVAGLVACAAFARRRAAILPGLAALLILAILAEAIAALSWSPRREYFSLGAALYGWLGGLVYARLVRRERTLADEAIAEAGCVAGMAATYMNAAISKLAGGGLDWSDGVALRAIVATHHRVDDTSVLGDYARIVLEHPGLSRAMLVATLVIQAGAFLYVVSPALRTVWGALLLSFHLNVLLLVHIAYMEAGMLLLLFSFPWPRIWARIRRRPGVAAPAAPDVAPAEGRRDLEAAALFMTVLFLATSLAWWLPLRAYTALHSHHAAAQGAATRSLPTR